MHKSEKMEDTCALKIIPIKLYTHLLYMHYQNLIIIRECSKKLLEMKNSKSFFLTPSTYTHRTYTKQQQQQLFIT